MVSSRPWHSLSLLMAVALVISACGSPAASASPTPSTAATATEAPSVAPSEAGEIVIGGVGPLSSRVTSSAATR